MTLHVSMGQVSMGGLVAAVLALAFAGCGSSIPAHEHPAPLSAAEHEEEAKIHEEQAEVDRQQVESHAEGQEVQCIDVGGPLESGGESMPVMQPCWTKSEQNSAHLRAAARQQKAADQHRHWAALLVEAEAEACGPLSKADRETSPFMRHGDILSVDEYREGGKSMGAVVVFRKVPRLSTEWFQASVRCHQARAAKLGFDPNFMSYSPLALQSVGSSVTETPDAIILTLRSKDPEVAAEVYGRALRSMSEVSVDETVLE